MSLSTSVKEYISDTFADGIAPSELPDDIDLIGTGILTSVTTVQLLGWCARTFSIPINSIMIDPQQLRTPSGIVEFIRQNRRDQISS